MVEMADIRKRSLADRVVEAVNKKIGQPTARVAVTPGPPEVERCGRCHRPMIICVGPYGLFLGCSGYPRCRGYKSQRRSCHADGRPKTPWPPPPPAPRSNACISCRSHTGTDRFCRPWWT
jgi:hypothetical protein